MEQMLAATDAGDADGAMNTTSPEGWKLPSYDLDVEGNPIKYGSPAEAKATIETAANQLRKTGGKVRTAMNGFDCQGTSTFAVCTADIVQTLTLPDSRQVQGTGRVTAAARKGNDGWKWTHWHISLAEPPAPAPAVVTPPPPPAPLLPLASANLKDLTWKDAPGMPGVQQAPVWEHPATHGHAVFMKVNKAVKLPRHYHTHATHVFVVKGGVVITDDMGKVHEVTQGGWYYEPSKVVHSTDVKAGTMILHLSEGPFDSVKVDDKGNPIPAVPSPTEPAAPPPKTLPAPPLGVHH